MSRAARDEQDDVLALASAAPSAFEDPEQLARLRRNAFQAVGLPYANGILYGLGVSQGMVDGLRVARRFATTLGGAPRHAGAGLPLLFQPREGLRASGFAGALDDSLEALVHTRDLGVSSEAVCHVSAGYASGWYSALLGEFQLVRELKCAATGAPRCEFQSRAAEQLVAERDPWATALMPYLNFDAMRKAALAKLEESEDAAEGEMMGAFDPLSPAVHVWGPVMVLPYSGAADSQAAVETIVADVGPGAVRVVVLDLTGARIGALEAAGLLRLLETFEACKLEAVIVGLPDDADASGLLRAGALGLPLRAADVTEGIILAFQLASFR